MSEKIPIWVPGFYAVMRHGGRSSDNWRPAYTFGNLPMAEAKFEEVKKNMRQGGLSLIDPSGIELRHYSGRGGRAMEERLLEELNVAEAKAWDSLGKYKFQMFGYWAAIWVHLNRIGGFKKPNPWRSLVKAARETTGAKQSVCQPVSGKVLDAVSPAMNDADDAVSLGAPTAQALLHE